MLLGRIPNESDAAELSAYCQEMSECLESSDELLHEARDYCDYAYTYGWDDGAKKYREAINAVLSDPPPMRPPLRPPWRTMTKEQMRTALFDANAPAETEEALNG